MGKALIIAEKPSVAADVARALGGFKRHQDYFESDDYVLSSAVGHLLEQIPPEGSEAKRGKWSFANLPVIPPYFDLKPIQKTASRLKTLVKLIKRKDVDALVNACDAGREGELIFRNIVRHAKAKQPVKRLWLQSMTPDAIRNGFVKLREDEEMQPLADAALSRSEADWLVGINGTRAMTAFNSKPGGFYKTTVGRVQTPTLAIVAEREAAIRDFRPEPYWEVTATFRAEGGEYEGRWFDEGFRKKENEPNARPERIWDESAAEDIREKCLGKEGGATEESKPTRQAPPPLFDLTSLQREANARFGLSANRTVQIAQALYERHKVLTYPRTDSRALPEDYVSTVKDSLGMLKGTDYARFADTILEQGWVQPNKRIFNDAKVSDHFAIIPTTEAPRRLNDIEQRIYDLVARRFLAIFYPPAEFLETTRITRVENEPFKTTGKVMVKAGWLEVHGRDTGRQGDETLAPLRAAAAEGAGTSGRAEAAEDTPAPVDDAGARTGQGAVAVRTLDAEVKPNETRPPARYTEATLLGAMEGAGKLVTDEDLRAAMAGKGLGTSATRASIIEGLLDEDYLIRDGKELHATSKAFMLMELLNGLGVRELTRPELTGNWEYQLFQMQGGKKSRNEFMGEIAEMTRQIVDRARQYEHDTIPGDFGSLSVPCPKCKGEVHERYRNYQCVNCDVSLPKILAGRLLSAKETEALIEDGQIGPLQGFRSRQGRPFAAVLKLSPEFRIAFDFGNESRNGDGESEPGADFTGQEPLGQCPRCAGRVFELPMRYVCENAVGDARTCEFSSGRIILRQEIPREQLVKLLKEGKSDLLPGFVSSRTGRRFKAFLALQDGKVGFEFEPRPAGKKAAAARNKPVTVKADFSGQEPLGKCPRCGGRVFEWDSQYVCEKFQAEKKPCRFKAGKVILEQPLERAQIAKLLDEGKTDLLPGFVSSKSGRSFAAWLTTDDDGKVTFEFPPRE